MFSASRTWSSDHSTLSLNEKDYTPYSTKHSSQVLYKFLFTIVNSQDPIIFLQKKVKIKILCGSWWWWWWCVCVCVCYVFITMSLAVVQSPSNRCLNLSKGRVNFLKERNLAPREFIKIFLYIWSPLDFASVTQSEQTSPRLLLEFGN